MRIKVDYTTVYEYAGTAADVVQRLRVEPRPNDDLHIMAWRVDIDADGKLRRGFDAFGNVVHMFYADHPLGRLAVHVTGEADSSDSGGVLRGGIEPLPPHLYLRQTRLTAPDAALKEYVRNFAGETPLAACHALGLSLNQRFSFDSDITHAWTDAAHAFALQGGVCQDYAHVFLACARLLGIPARYVSGHLVRADGLHTQPAAHAWAEAWIPDLGWTGFDPINGISTTEAHLRVAVGLDYLDAAPVRGARRGGGTESLAVTVTARDMPMPAQIQRQLQGQA